MAVLAPSGGYNSKFGDGDELSLDLCQACTKTLLGHAIRSHGNAYGMEVRAHFEATPQAQQVLTQKCFTKGKA